MALLDLLGRRWALGIIWILAENGPQSFTALQVKCETISPGVLATRLKELQMARLIKPTQKGYAANTLGQQLYDHIAPLGEWARHEWAPEQST